jgi:hypothetical protein
MKVRKLYKYIGRNGSVTTPILLDDAKYIPLVELRADPGYVLKNDDGVTKQSVVVYIDDAELWNEVPADMNE